MDKEKRIEEIAVQILKYSRNELMVALRFMDLALCRLEYRRAETQRISTDGKYLYYNPRHVFGLYETGNGELNHSHLHTVLHCVFFHPFIGRGVSQPLWDLVCDIAVESIISELGLRQAECADAPVIDRELDELRQRFGRLTAEKIYRELQLAEISGSELERLRTFFSFDDHDIWYPEDGDDSRDDHDRGRGKNEDRSEESESRISENSESTEDDEKGDTPSISKLQAEWKEVSEKMQMDLESFSREHGDRAGSLMQNLAAVNRKRYDYASFLRKFTTLGEVMKINDDEFDYIYYTYGLKLYDRMPLIEPLEYKEVKRVKEFVIAIDTSGSTSGKLVQRFVQKTYDILKSTENFFSKINLHIIQCDAEIQEHAKISCQEEFDSYMENMQLRGFGGTDFRPVFKAVDDMVANKEFENLKGMIYLTDGCGTFPEKKPAYDAAFVFIDDGTLSPSVPPWAIKLVLQSDEI